VLGGAAERKSYKRAPCAKAVACEALEKGLATPVLQNQWYWNTTL
jgi:hypothetical protein